MQRQILKPADRRLETGVTSQVSVSARTQFVFRVRGMVDKVFQKSVERIFLPGRKFSFLAYRAATPGLQQPSCDLVVSGRSLPTE